MFSTLNQLSLPVSARPRTLGLAVLIGSFLPVFGAAEGGGCGSVNSRSAAPDVSGAWAIDYDDTYDIEIELGGAVHRQTIGTQGGSVTIDHNGRPLTFDLACERPEVVCPSEVWPSTVTLTQRNKEFPHRMFATLPFQKCNGRLVAPEPASCGEGTLNEDCDDICEGEVVVESTDRFGVINEAGTAFDLLLGAGIASNGVNCALLGVSVAKANLVTTGTARDGDWRASAMRDGQVITSYAGGCLWAGDPNDDGALEAVVLGAKVTLTTGFAGARR